jgi:hypothetical protein
MTVWSNQLNAIYSTPIAKTAQMQAGSGGAAFDLKIIDKTDGISIANDAGGQLLTIEAAAYIRMSSLEDQGLTEADINGGTLTVNDKAWRITSHILKPNPDGEKKGEACLILSDEDI